MLRRWLETPEVRRWWGDPDEQEALLREDLAGEDMTMWIVCLNGSPFGYAQHCDVHGWPQPHVAHLPAGSIAIDAFVGKPEMIGKGNGARFLRLLAERIRRSGAPEIVIDPDPANERAIRAYRNAGFVGDAIYETEDGPALLMHFRPGD
jgi:aminoglycoside 6'-N-acetyltransferase